MQYSLLQSRHGNLLVEGQDMIGKLLRIYGEWAETSIELLLPLLPAGGVAVDVGAHIGCFTLPFARAVGPQGRVLAFEPQRRLFQNLCANLLLNDLSWVEPHQCLLAPSAGSTLAPLREIDAFRSANLNRGGVDFLPNLAAPDQATGSDRLLLHSLDEWLIEADRCDLIKLDVSGAEALVLQGMVGTIARHFPYLYIDCGSREQSGLLLPLLQAFQYTVHWHGCPHFRADNPQGMANVTGRHADLNLLCVPQERRNDPEAAALWADLPHAGEWDELTILFPELQFS